MARRAVRVVLFDRAAEFTDAVEACLARLGVRAALPAHVTVETCGGCDVRGLARRLGAEGAQGVAYVSPANSAGWMDGGLDAVYCEMFPGVQERVQASIRRVGLRTAGGRAYLPVGSALTVRLPCGSSLVCAPTMFRPADVSRTRHAYRAGVAALAAFLRSLEAPGSAPAVLACPALCCGYGCMPPAASAAQVCEALRDVLALGRVPPAVRMAADPLYYVAEDHDELVT